MSLYAKASALAQRLLLASTALLFPRQYDKVTPLTQDIGTSPIISHLVFQMLIYYNIYLYPVLAIGTITTLAWKAQNFQMSIFHFIMIVFFDGMLIMLEPVRLSLAYHGNLYEKVRQC